jgi:hypothetical protein
MHMLTEAQEVAELYMDVRGGATDAHADKLVRESSMR